MALATEALNLRTTSPGEDAEQVRHLEREPPPRVLVTSDLHLGEGLNAATGQIVRTENFLQDGAYSRFVDFHLADIAARAEDDESYRRPALLILDGDIVDFPRITDVPTTDEHFEQWRSLLGQLGCDKTDKELRDSISRKERKFGFRTNDYKAVWKFDRVMRGHAVFFDALARWVAAGHHVLYIKGNHDVEIEHALVRRAFRAAVVGGGAEVDHAEERVRFEMEGVKLHNVWIEHGHQFEAMTRIVGEPFLEDRPGELNQPIGNFVNRYLLNPIEDMRPFLNNIKPVQGVLWKLLKHHPVKAVGVLFRSTRFIPRAIEMQRFRELLGVGLYLLFLLGGWVLGLALLGLLVGLAAGGFADFAGAAIQITAVALLAGFAAPIVTGALSELVDRIRDRHVSPYVRDVVGAIPADMAQEGYQLTYVVVGHTHEQDSQRFEWQPVVDSPTMYLNTGTWIPIWSDDRPDLHGRTLRPFVQLDLNPELGEYRHQHLQWNDARGAPEPSVVFTSAKGTG